MDVDPSLPVANVFTLVILVATVFTLAILVATVGTLVPTST